LPIVGEPKAVVAAGWPFDGLDVIVFELATARGVAEQAFEPAIVAPVAALVFVAESFAEQVFESVILGRVVERASELATVDCVVAFVFVELGALVLVVFSSAPVELVFQPFVLAGLVVLMGSLIEKFCQLASAGWPFRLFVGLWYFFVHFHLC
jgi:hypothetical protein